MILRYQISSKTTSDITEIADANKSGDKMFFIPVNPTLADIIVKDVSDDDYEQIIDMLFNAGKADIVRFKDKTFYSCEE